MTALRVFEAAARHLSCTGAADELFLTQSAVSKQLRALEEHLGVVLFERENRGLVLTELGRTYLGEIRPLLAQIAAATARLSLQRRPGVSLTLSIVSIVGDRWLLPMFGEFTRAHPEIDVQFTNLLSSDKQTTSGPDAAFLGGEGVWPGSVVDYLFGREVALLASPELMARGDGLQQLADVPRYPLLNHFQRPEAWNEFFAANGLEPQPASRVIRYEFFATIIQAAIAGMGLALVPRVFVQDEMARGALVNPLGLGVASRRGYYFVVPEHKLSSPGLATLRSWVLDRAEATRRGLGA